MREMVDKVKAGKPLYGESKMSEHLQGVAARNSRYSAVFNHLLPWFNFANHNQVSAHELLPRKRSLTMFSMALIPPSITSRQSVSWPRRANKQTAASNEKCSGGACEVNQGLERLTVSCQQHLLYIGFRGVPIHLQARPSQRIQ